MQSKVVLHYEWGEVINGESSGVIWMQMDMEVGSEMERRGGKDVGQPFTTFIVNKSQSEPQYG